MIQSFVLLAVMIGLGYLFSGGLGVLSAVVLYLFLVMYLSGHRALSASRK
jgi:hypothetical protein